jgi:aminoglycoside/choline kinase family phosphotransferase
LNGEDRISVRRARLEGWIGDLLGGRGFELEPASGDASLRRYWRVQTRGDSLIAVDAPPRREEVARFVDIAERLRTVGLTTPEIHARDDGEGFLLLTDLGRDLYRDVLDPLNADRLYGDAIGALLVIQACASSEGLPLYDGPFFRRELGLFDEWLLDRHLGLRLSPADWNQLGGAYEVLVASALEQPRVFVHRDFHSRNLLLTRPPSPGILDFQDAVLGPVTYDLVSLLRDCYIAWPEERVRSWAEGYLELALQSGILREADECHFTRWFDLAGIQRHLKASGIFARLQLRDGKSGYLKDIPRTLEYVAAVASHYPELHGLAQLVSDRVFPLLRTM